MHRKEAKDRRAIQIPCRHNEEESSMIREKAKKRGLPIAKYIRFLVNQDNPDGTK